MKLRRVELVGLVALLLVLILASACGGTSQAPLGDQAALDGRTLLEERCTACHSIERTTGQKMTRDEWEETVTRMVNKGAELNEEETTILVDFLAENYGP